MTMKLINRKTDYTIRAIAYIGRCKRRFVPVSEIAQSLCIPRPFLRKILQILHTHGMLNAREGREGGFSLAVPLKKIFLTDLITILQGPVKLVDCLMKKRFCPVAKNCILKKKIEAIEQLVKNKLQAITIASLFT